MSERAPRVGVLGVVGGCGATTVACALALSWARDRSTRLVDMDLVTGDIAARWGVRCGRTVADLLAVAEQLAPDLVARAEYPLRDHLTLVAAPDGPTARPADRVVRVLMTALGGPHTVIDLGSRPDQTAIAALAAAGRGLIVAPGTVRAITRARTIADAVAPLTCSLVLCEGAAAELGSRSATRLSGLPVLAVLPRSRRAAAAIDAGRRPRGRRFVRAIDEIGSAVA
jgi:pilus assembly protein CpaE